MEKVQIDAKQYLKALAESLRESIDPVTDMLEITGDFAKDVADSLQKIGEAMK